MKEIIGRLPNSSGFTLENWEIDNDNVIAHLSYHVLNEAGYYEDYVFFTVYVDRQTGQFSLEIDPASQRLADKYALQEFLEDTIAFSLEVE